MIRVVVDTNVWISALVLQGELRRFVELSGRHRLKLLTSVPLLEEFSRVAREKFHKSANQVEAYRKNILDFADVVEATERIGILNHDPDNRVLECAIAGDGDVIVGGDRKHMLSLKEFRGIRIIAPAEFLDRYL